MAATVGRLLDLRQRAGASAAFRYDAPGGATHGLVTVTRLDDGTRVQRSVSPGTFQLELVPGKNYALVAAALRADQTLAGLSNVLLFAMPMRSGGDVRIAWETDYAKGRAVEVPAGAKRHRVEANRAAHWLSVTVDGSARDGPMAVSGLSVEARGKGLAGSATEYAP